MQYKYISFCCIVLSTALYCKLSVHAGLYCLSVLSARPVAVHVVPVWLCVSAGHGDNSFISRRWHWSDILVPSRQRLSVVVTDVVCCCICQVCALVVSTRRPCFELIFGWCEQDYSTVLWMDFLKIYGRAGLGRCNNQFVFGNSGSVKLIFIIIFSHFTGFCTSHVMCCL